MTRPELAVIDPARYPDPASYYRAKWWALPADVRSRYGVRSAMFTDEAIAEWEAARA